MPFFFSKAFVFIVLVTTSVTFVAVKPVMATTLPPAFASIETLPGNQPNTYTNGPPPQVSEIVNGDGAGGASATSNLVGASVTGSAAANATETYYYAVTGPANTNPVPLLASYHIDANASSFIGANGLEEGAIASISDNGTLLGYKSTPLTTPGAISIAGPQSFTTLEGQQNEIELYVNVGAGDPLYKLGMFAQASAGLNLQIDPTWLAANPGYSLKFSAGIDNAPVSAVPLPPSALMFTTALLALSVFAWRQRKA